jgi:hypothetical protein
MDMFGHDYVSSDVETVSVTRTLESFNKDVASLRGVQERRPVITAEGDEVEISCLLISL